MAEFKKKDIKDFSRSELRETLKNLGLKPYRADQIFKWTYLKQADSFEEMTDIKKEERLFLADHFHLERLRIKTIETSRDGTRKFLFELEDGKFTEAVLIPEKDHFTVCISSQVGCAQACRFCLTAQGGFVRNLTSGEIISQVRDLKNYLVEKDPQEARPLSNIVYMGMGEPLANYKEVVKSLETITDGDFGLKISGRRITVSTSGLVPKLADLGRDTSVNLAVSLNATDNKTRSRLMPINKTYPIETLLSACRDYPAKQSRKITFEYILMKGVNDSIEDAKRLIKLLRPIKAKINLIPFNEHDGSEFKRPSDASIESFLKRLQDAGYTAIIRKSKGQDISAACGQLSANARSKEKEC